MTGKPKARIRKQMGDIRFRTGDEVIQTQNFPALFNKVVA
jgi:hypothetical protein